MLQRKINSANILFKLDGLFILNSEMLETRRKELEEELVRVEENAKAREERMREKGNQAPAIGERDADLEELEAEIELYALALGEEKDEDMELNPAEAIQGPLKFPEPDEAMDSA